MIDCRGNAQGASGGLVLFERMRVRGCAGVVSDGGVRDAADIVDTGFPGLRQGGLPAEQPRRAPLRRAPGARHLRRGRGVSRRLHRRRPGRRRRRARPTWPPKSPNEAAAYEDKEEFIIRRIRAGASVFGTYPLTGEGLAEYEANRRRQSGCRRSSSTLHCWPQSIVQPDRVSLRRSASLATPIAITTTAIASPGRVAIHQALSR